MVNDIFERVQIDLIDMRHEPDEQFQWIVHVKDHFSKYSCLYPLRSKHAQGVANCLSMWLRNFRPMKILQCDNGKEFKGALLILIKLTVSKLLMGDHEHHKHKGL